MHEGLRVYNRGVFRLAEHVDRLFRCAAAIGIEMTKFYGADVTGTVNEIVPVIEIDGRRVGAQPGPVARGLLFSIRRDRKPR